ncbi:MAG: L-threonylcarbamoyladenylate synthase [Hyphomicrobium sp.]|uniref:L-threonylcarbamoyladenylate synthase n=1 Tax=Hyphomicrobium sp. TaxID=82 RepID=UPI003D0DA5A9
MPVRPADSEAIEAAGRLLVAGELVALPTETVYGLAGDATNGEAVARIFATKGRPRFNPLIVHVPDVPAALRIAVVTGAALKLAQAFWPGPLTLVMTRRPEAGLSDLVSAGLDSIAVRVPAHPIARAVLAVAGRPLAAPSANRSGRVSPTTAQHVADDLGHDVRLILDGGATQHGLESTVVDVTAQEHATLLRPGALPREAIEAVLGEKLADGPASDDVHPSSPGQLASHYAPDAALRLDATDVRPGEALLAFGSQVPATRGPVINLSPSGDLIEAAAALFSALRALDQGGSTVIAVMPIPAHGLGEAINDRLRRAAAPRS